MHDIGDIIHVDDLMQRDYSYELDASSGEDFAEGFNPCFSPKQMLEMGVFEGKYLNDCQQEFPSDWFINARISNMADSNLNYFGIKSRQPLQIWREKDWIIGPDPRGWFQWFCRYYLGRRISEIDEAQIKRWRNFTRHAGQIRANCKAGDLTCRPKQRQALLQWSHDCFI